MAWLLVRLVFSLLLVAGVLWFAARLARRRGFGGGQGRLVEVLARQPMGRTSSVSVIRVVDRVLVVGSTDASITLLAEVDEESVAEALGEGAGGGVDDPSGDPVDDLDGELAGLVGGRALPQPAGQPVAVRRAAPPRSAVRPAGLVAGSVLDRAQWSSLVQVLRDRTVRR